MTFSFKPHSNNRKIELQIEGLKKSTRKGIRKAFYFIGKDLVADARKSILDKNKSGIVYTIFKNGRRFNHVSSAPGQAPANLTGDLRKSVDFKVHGIDRLEFGADTPYAKALELGNPAGNLEKRPYLIAAIQKNEKNTRQHFAQQIKKFTKRT
ncbi:hypothetical protein LCGC14_2350720 [marine sediment metagenome]|uniref:HK97 gp10 family phage protein n=1 Tax=marine sediment metagenome TaxID=412755 RepID=A0A0F9C9W2_9ZZZZ|nr:hypothetical protein [Candidatus Scalindua sp.]